MSLPERLSNLPQDTQQQTSDRAGVQTPRPGHFSHTQESGLDTGFLTARRVTWVAGVLGPSEECADASTPHCVSRRDGLFPLGKRKIEESGVRPYYKETVQQKSPSIFKKIFTWLCMNTGVITAKKINK